MIPHIKFLSENGYDISLACSNVGNRIDELRGLLNGITITEVRLKRSPMAIENFVGYKELKKLINENNFDIIWTNEPVMGVVTRLAAKKARKSGAKVVYIAHGFHFYKGAPLKNWLLFYPIEWLASFLTDLLITINIEDYNRSQNMHAKETKYIHGIGINTGRLNNTNKTDIRKELGLKDDAFLVLSVGELNKNKNQKVIIKALAEISDKDIHYILCGKGNQKDNLDKLAKKLNVHNQVHFLGYRKDIVDIYFGADVFVMPTYREGLGLAALEAMYCGLPVIGSSNRGLRDVVLHNKNGFLGNSNDYDFFAKSIKQLKENVNERKLFGEKGKEVSEHYIFENVKIEVRDIFVDKY